MFRDYSGKNSGLPFGVRKHGTGFIANVWFDGVQQFGTTRRTIAEAAADAQRMKKEVFRVMHWRMIVQGHYKIAQLLVPYTK